MAQGSVIYFNFEVLAGKRFCLWLITRRHPRMKNFHLAETVLYQYLDCEFTRNRNLIKLSGAERAQHTCLTQETPIQLLQ